MTRVASTRIRGGPSVADERDLVPLVQGFDERVQPQSKISYSVLGVGTRIDEQRDLSTGGVLADPQHLTNRLILAHQEVVGLQAHDRLLFLSSTLTIICRSTDCADGAPANATTIRATRSLEEEWYMDNCSIGFALRHRQDSLR